MTSRIHNPNRLLRLDPSVYDQFASTCEHIDTVRRVTAHIEAHLGSVEHIYRGKIQGQPQIDILTIPPTSHRDSFTIVTAGMSDLPMTTPRNLHQYRFAELYMHMPATWNYDTAPWPIELLAELAQLPHKTASWLGYGHNTSLDDHGISSVPLPFTGALLASSLFQNEQFQTLQVSPGKRIYFYNVCPLQADELELVQRTGPTYLEDLLISQGLTGAVDVHRQSVLAPGNPKLMKTKGINAPCVSS
jgi:hypothetical protein